MLYLFIILVIGIVLALLKNRLDNFFRRQTRPKVPEAYMKFLYPYVKLANKNCEIEVNKFLKDMRCEHCRTNEVPCYKIADNKTTINCCCEKFAKVLEDRINKKHEISYENLATTSITINGFTGGRSVEIIPFVPKTESREFNQYRPITNPIFEPINIDLLGNSPIEREIRNYQYPIVACHIGTLESGNEYALIIGINDEWINVLTLNRRKKPTYMSYGYNIDEKRWSYNSRVFGASQIRSVIKSNMSEIILIMATQEIVRQARWLNKDENEEFN